LDGKTFLARNESKNGACILSSFALTFFFVGIIFVPFISLVWQGPSFLVLKS
jgi:hypothetical protein